MGPSFTVDAACASALLAIEIGVRDLLSHKCDLALVGGVERERAVADLGLFCQLGALSRREQIRPFDKDADGTILGEGLGMIVLKRRADAERDGNRIYAVIKGVGIASDGRALHVMAPRVEGEELALRRAYEMAGVSPRTRRADRSARHGDSGRRCGRDTGAEAASSANAKAHSALRARLGEVDDRPHHAGRGDRRA